MGAVARSLLADLEESFLVFIESVPDAMVLSDRSGRIVLVNSNTEKLFGYSHDELLGKQVEILIPARFREDHLRHRADYYADASRRPMEPRRELLALRKDGTELRVEINLSPVQIGGETLVWSAIRNATEREAAISRVRIALKKQRNHGALLSTCAWCKRVRDEAGSWLSMEQYVLSHSDTKFTHGLCQDCLRKLDPNLKAA
jgi:PAS domain S-box-containing protein